VKYWEIIADRLSKAGWSLGWVLGVDSQGRTIWIADAHRGGGRRFVVRRISSQISRHASPRGGFLFHAALRFCEIPRVLLRFDHVALTDLTHFRIFPRNLEPDFTHYLCEQRKENGNL
jgi:hypothetical protein